MKANKAEEKNTINLRTLYFQGGKQLTVTPEMFLFLFLFCHRGKAKQSWIRQKQQTKNWLSCYGTSLKNVWQKPKILFQFGKNDCSDFIVVCL